MTSLIERDALIAEYDRVHVGEAGKARKLIEEAPEVYAVPVVRCKDCKYNLNGLCDQISLDWHPFRVEEDEFCAWGKRKDNG